MLTVTFRAKPQSVQDFQTLQFRDVVYIPKIKKNHCSMSAFRISKAYGCYANSDLFENMIRGTVKKMVGDYIILDNLPDSVTVEDGFLKTVTITIPDEKTY